jgi:hypothetical protein
MASYAPVSDECADEKYRGPLGKAR